MPYSLSLLVLMFIAYSFIGWVCEMTYRYVMDHKWYGRGFLTLPILPIYGFGALFILLFVEPYVHNPFIVFIASAVMGSVLEYLSHLFIDKVFHIRLWDYSDNRFNLQGRICLQYSLSFGILALLLVYVVHPVLTTALAMIPEFISIIIAIVLGAVVIVDFANSVSSLIRVRMDKIRDTLADMYERLTGELAHLREGARPRKGSLAHRFLIQIHRFNLNRFIKAFPNAKRR